MIGIRVNFCNHHQVCTAAWIFLASFTCTSLAQEKTGFEKPVFPMENSLMLQEKIQPEQQEDLPFYLLSDGLEGTQDDFLRLHGNAQMRRGYTSVRADELFYFSNERNVKAIGDVHINQAGDIYQGDKLELNIDSFEGHFDNVQYYLRENQANGDAKIINFLSRDKYHIKQGNYTTCQRQDYDENWHPAWQIRAGDLYIDKLKNEGVARNAVLEFKGIPIFGSPYLTFPVTKERKSGLLLPTAGFDSIAGLSYEQPYYWNIAPHMDATFTVGLMQRRGVDLGGKFRYLQSRYSGSIAGHWLPSDRLRQTNRWDITLKHNHSLSTPIGDLSLDADIMRVSDADYWRDLRRNRRDFNDENSYRLVPSNIRLTGGRGDWNWRMRTLKWQVLQDPYSEIVPPYDLLPQLHVSYAPWQSFANTEFRLDLNTTRFQADSRFKNNLTSGQRNYIAANLSRSFVAPYGFVTPALQLHGTHYKLDRTSQSQQNRTFNRFLPTTSLDAGLFFERSTRLFERALIQTLEPRFFYAYTPYKDQSMLPMYDTAEMDFTFSSIFSPNSYVGHDRIADNNMMTFGLTSRFLDKSTGAELARIGAAQRFRFRDSLVLPAQAERRSDALFGAAINWNSKWSANTSLQYDFRSSHAVRYTFSTHYKPDNFKVLSTSYRMKQDASKQVDFAWQWPLQDFLPGLRRYDFKKAVAKSQEGRWYTVGRLNYNLRDKKMVDTIFGVEYSSCCWATRVVVERLQDSPIRATTRLLLQLELIGLSSVNIGSNPFASIQKNVPYYQNVSATGISPRSRFDRYD